MVSYFSYCTSHLTCSYKVGLKSMVSTGTVHTENVWYVTAILAVMMALYSPRPPNTNIDHSG